MGKFRLIAGFATAFLLLAAGSAAASIRAVGVWHFNEGAGTVAHDSTRNHNDGVLQGGAQRTGGRFRDAVSFDGGSAVRVPNDPALEPPEISVSAWVKSSTSPGNFKYIVGKGGNACLAGSYGLYTGDSAGLQFYTSANQGLSYSLSPDAGTRVWDGKWHNVIGTYDGSSVRLYVDGRQVGAGTPNSSPIAYDLPTSNDLAIGNYIGCQTIKLGFTGRIDEVRIFDRALSPFEIGFGFELSRLLPFESPRDLIR